MIGYSYQCLLVVHYELEGCDILHQSFSCYILGWKMIIFSIKVFQRNILSRKMVIFSIKVNLVNSGLENCDIDHLNCVQPGLKITFSISEFVYLIQENVHGRLLYSEVESDIN